MTMNWGLFWLIFLFGFAIGITFMLIIFAAEASKKSEENKRKWQVKNKRQANDRGNVCNAQGGDSEPNPAT